MTGQLRQRIIRAGGGAIALALILLLTSTTVYGQQFSAQIQQFWNQLRTGALVFSHLRTVDATCSGTCTGFGGGGGTPGGANTSVQFNNGGAFGGFGTWASSALTVPGLILADTGTIAASTPYQFTQTWSNPAVTFHGFDVIANGVTSTDFGSTSTAFRVFQGTPAAGVRCYFGIGTTMSSSGCFVGISSDGNMYTGEINPTSVNATSTRFAIQMNRQYLDTVTANTLQMAAQSGGVSVTFMTGAAPALTSGWGAGATIVGNSSVGRITVGTAPSVTQVLTFVESFATNAPHCEFVNEVGGSAVITLITPTVSNVTIHGTPTAADTISYHCVGFQ